MASKKKTSSIGFEFKPINLSDTPATTLAATVAKAKAAKKSSPTQVRTPAVRTVDRAVTRFKAMLPDIEGLAEKIIQSDLDHTQAIEVESRADDLVDWAPNALVWCADKRFLGMRPYAKQAEILLWLFEEFCPRCTDMTYLADIPTKDTVEQIMAKVGLLEFGVCPHCAYSRADGRAAGVFHDPLELIAVIGQRAGKSALVAMCISYLIHRNLHLPSPWKVYGLTPGQVIDFTVVATTVGQSEKTLWSTFKGVFTGSHWFKAYKAACDEEGKKHGIKETVKASETFLWFDHKGILVYFAANNPSGLRGTTRFGAAIDELGWFDGESGSNKVRANGPETYSALNNACLTLRGAVDDAIAANPRSNLPMPVLFNISSPRAMNDAIMTVYRERASDTRVVRRHWPTWVVNPHLTKKKLERELSTPNGVRDFGAQPPITDDPLVQRMYVVTDAFKTPLATDPRYGPVLIPSIVGYVDELDVPSGQATLNYVTGALEPTSPVPDFQGVASRLASDLDTAAALGPLGSVMGELIKRPPLSRPHVMGVDLGATTNALAVVCGYVAGNKFITDFALEIKPSGSRGVNIADVYDRLIVPLVERLNVVAVFYDTWSSLHQIQALAQRFGALGPLNTSRDRRKWLLDLQHKKMKPRFLADQYSLNLADALMLVTRLEQGDCLFPALEVPVMELLVNKKLNPADYPFAHLALQISTVRARGNRLLKPVGADDDLFRAWANAAVKALTDDMVIGLLAQEGRTIDVKAQQQTQRGHVSMGSVGMGLRRTETTSQVALSNKVGGMPVIVKRGSRGAWQRQR